MSLRTLLDRVDGAIIAAIREPLGKPVKFAYAAPGRWVTIEIVAKSPAGEIPSPIMTDYPDPLLPDEEDRPKRYAQADLDALGRAMDQHSAELEAEWAGEEDGA